MKASMIEVLPQEILHEIHWWSFNPEFCLVSKALNLMLPASRAFESDVMIALFCRTDGPYAAWDDLDLPWRTLPGNEHDLRLSTRERIELQRAIVSQQWFTMVKLKHAASMISRAWIEAHWDITTLTAQEKHGLSAYLDPGSPQFLAEGIQFPGIYDRHYNMLSVGPKTRMSVLTAK